jgi:hypothetical protein
LYKLQLSYNFYNFLFSSQIYVSRLFLDKIPESGKKRRDGKIPAISPISCPKKKEAREKEEREREREISSILNRERKT